MKNPHLLTLSFIIFHCVCANYEETNQNERLLTAMREKISLYKMAISNTGESIQMYGYSSEIHKVTTPDGYILNTYRMSNNVSQSRAPVLLLSGFSTTSAVYTIFNESLAFRLHKEGYDVWLGHFRGILQESEHVKYSKSQYKFWDFSFEEMADYDLPSMIDYILNVTGYSQLSLVTYSLSTLITGALQSTKLEYNNKIKRNVAVAPVLYISYRMDFTLKPVISRVKAIKEVFLGKDKYDLILANLLSYGFPLICLTFGKVPCQLFNMFTVGYNPNKQYGDLLGLTFAYAFKGTSIKNYMHAFDAVIGGPIRRYDYGQHENLKKYGTELPPIYNFSQITSPTSFFYAAGDCLSTPLNVEMGARQVKSVRKELMPEVMFTHIDFAANSDVLNTVNNKILQHLSL